MLGNRENWLMLVIIMSTAIGIIGGSGLYQLEGFTQTEEKEVETPFGAPSSPLIGGTFAGRQVWFLPRHGKKHHLLPHEINHRANIWALRSLDVRFLICVTAVGSLKLDYRPGDIVLPDQFFDRTSQRQKQTFFGNGIVAHISFGQPISRKLRQILCQSAAKELLNYHDGGTYVNIDGPAFSTRAESEVNRQLGFDVVGMTNLPEAKLAREAEIALATLAMITDYDCWHEEEVTADGVTALLKQNAANAQKIIAHAIPHIPEAAEWPEHSSLQSAIFSQPADWPAEAAKRLQPILGDKFH